MLKKLNTLLFLLLGCIFFSCDKDSSTSSSTPPPTTIKEASDIVGKWKLVDYDFFYDGKEIPVDISKEYFYYLWGTNSGEGGQLMASYYGPEDIPPYYTNYFVFLESGDAYFFFFLGDDDDFDYENYPPDFNWTFLGGQGVFQQGQINVDGEERLSVYGNYLVEAEWLLDTATGYYISDHFIEDYDTPGVIQWLGYDGREHEYSELHKFEKQ